MPLYYAMKRTLNPRRPLAVPVAQVVVGVLFIISGLVKANDPMGLGYKMQEFFEAWNSDLFESHFFLKTPLIHFFEMLHEHSLPLSVVMIVLEIMAGVALLVGWRKKLVLYGLLVLIIFFTFLTGYAYASGKFKNCGCFGDCLPITPLTSFLKDLILLALILFLCFMQRWVRPLGNARFRTGMLLLFLLISIGFQAYVLRHLPVADCLPFKKGNNIAAQMLPPKGSVPDSFAIRFIYKKGDKQYEFSPTDLPADLGSYTFVDRTDKLIRKGNADPAIKGLSFIGTSGVDSTQIILNEEKVLLLFHLSTPSNDNWKKDFAAIYQQAVQQGISVYMVTSTLNQATSMLQGSAFAGVPVFASDITVIRSAARTPLVLYYLNKGTVINKWSSADFDKAGSFLSSASNTKTSP